MIIIKLGGSVITDKKAYRKFRPDITNSIIQYIMKLNERIILVHGGGSFGHIKSHEYGLPGPANERSRIGFSIVHRDMAELNNLVSSIAIGMGMPIISVPISSIYCCGKIDYSTMEEYAESGFVPASYGDVYIKDRNTYGIYSGDDIVLDLARIFRPDRVMFLTDVDGIYDRDPKKYADAKLLHSLNESFTLGIVENDVTGGIKNKMKAMHSISEFCNSVYLMNGFHPERMMDAGSEKFIGTVIR
ncbi:MAG: isopentenyl phosphate kinase [Thermoplasmata archaeon]